MSVQIRFRPSEGRAPVSVEPMRRRHLRRIMPIEEQVYPRPWTQGIFEGEIESMRTGDRYYVVAKQGRRLVGYGGMIYAIDEAHITNIAVDPERHRQGIGRQLMLAFAHEARRRGIVKMTLEVRVSNLAAQALYERFGFVSAGTRPRYYEGVEDALVMWCHDVASIDYAARLAVIEREGL